MRESWQATFGGRGNANKIVVLEEGVKYTPISISPEQGCDLYLINGNMTKLEDAGIFAEDNGKEEGNIDEEVLKLEKQKDQRLILLHSGWLRTALIPRAIRPSIRRPSTHLS